VLEELKKLGVWIEDGLIRVKKLVASLIETILDWKIKTGA